MEIVEGQRAESGVSSRYTFVSTAQVVDLLRGEGWEPVKANQQRVRLENRPELILQNAHDGTRAYRIDAGLYRLVCRNGLTVADTDFAHVAIRHVDVSAEKFAVAAQAVAENTPRVLEVIARWQAVGLTPLARHSFAARAMALRWDSSQPVTRLLRPDQLLAPARYGDQATDLWTTFNVVQERLCRGGLRYAGHIPTTEEEVFPTHYLRNTTRPVGGLTEGQRLNKALWNLAEEFSRN